MGTPTEVDPSSIISRIVSVRGQRVLFDSDLAEVYGVTTERLNQQVNRNIERFPADFIFSLEPQEHANLKLQIATSSSGRAHGGARKPPRLFTEHGAIMAATLARRLETLEKSVAALDASTRKHFDQVYEAILGLMAPAQRRS